MAGELSWVEGATENSSVSCLSFEIRAVNNISKCNICKNAVVVKVADTEDTVRRERT